MVAHIRTVAFQGVEAVPVDVQVQMSSGLPAFAIVGLPDKAVAESRERVRAALTAIGLGLPPKRITVNMAPADLPKEGSHFDLAVALGLMAVMGVVDPARLAQYVVLGELSLDGSVTAVMGVLPAAIAANASDLGLICPQDQGSEAAWAGDGLEILAPADLIQIVNHFKGTEFLVRPSPGQSEDGGSLPDLKDVKGQDNAKRILEVAASGGHNLLMCGPPGAGKSMLAQRLPSILPPLDSAEMLQVSMIASLAGELANGRMSRRRPFRSPHHSASQAALVGGGHKARPGEVSLAHMGVLFLDELPEFSPRVLDALRQPLETGETTIARANHHVTYPSRVQLIAAMNPCRCGYAGQPGHVCRRGLRCAADYQARISGPLLDRIDLHVEVAPAHVIDLVLPPPREASADVALRVHDARLRQHTRYEEHGRTDIRTNAEVDGELLEQVARPDQAGLSLLRDAADAMSLSARGFHRVLKVARTVADLEGADTIGRIHIAEALAYRGRPQSLV